MTTKADALKRLTDSSCGLLRNQIEAVEKELARYSGHPVEFRMEGLPELVVESLAKELRAAGWTVEPCQVDGKHADQRDPYKAPGLRIS